MFFFKVKKRSGGDGDDKLFSLGCHVEMLGRKKAPGGDFRTPETMASGVDISEERIALDEGSARLYDVSHEH